MALTSTDPTTDSRRESRHADQLRDAAIVQTAQHGEALRAGGYTSGLGDEVLVTDPAEFSHEDVATFYLLAAQVIDQRLNHQQSLTPVEDRFVSRVLDHAGLEL